MAENQQLEPYFAYLKQLEALLNDELSGWQTRVGYFPPSGKANNVSIALYKPNWFNDISDGIHFETWFGNADIKRSAFPIALHVEASKDKTGLQRGIFNQYVIVNAGDMIAEWEGYNLSPKSYQLLIARLPFQLDTLVEQMLHEYRRMVSLADVIDAGILAAT